MCRIISKHAWYLLGFFVGCVDLVEADDVDNADSPVAVSLPGQHEWVDRSSDAGFISGSGGGQHSPTIWKTDPGPFRVYIIYIIKFNALL